ncbi:MAG: hypothetical protein QOH56_975, partial [Pseudonocardiales bacterium]|nr:hypothetical protein [Pseudonocardiales bacterium]
MTTSFQSTATSVAADQPSPARRRVSARWRRRGGIYLARLTLMAVLIGGWQ